MQGRTEQRRESPLAAPLIGAGLVLMGCGFVYDVMFAGIPYQDPTPELAASYLRHVRIRWKRTT